MTEVNKELLADEIDLEIKENDMLRISITSQDDRGTFTNLNVEAKMSAGKLSFIKEE